MRILLVCLLALFIVACTQQAPPAMPALQDGSKPVVNTTPEEPKPQLTPPQPLEPVVKNEVTTVFDGLPSDVQTIIQNGEKNTASKGYSYTLDIRQGAFQSTHPAQGAKVYQLGAHSKIVLVKPKQRIEPADYVQTVYLDAEAKTATGTCTDTVLCKDAIGVRTASYDTYAFMAPSDWINQMKSPVKMEEKTIENRKAIRLDADVNGARASIWVDRYSGLPIEVDEGDTIYTYQGFALGVLPADVTP